MPGTRQLINGVAGFVLLGIYSWIMIGTNGEAASWAWLVLVAAITLLAVAARAAIVARQADDGR